MFTQCAVVASERDVVQACGLVCCMLRASVRCAVRGLLACAALPDARDDADVALWWVGLVASCVSVRACAWCDGSGERGAGRHVREMRVGLAKM